ncbi:Myo-inositol 2-dehydrogenase [Pseudonocardia sp. Ae168_Ps1]|uniref:Gfo/Idh/MocA family protein n=1 Tax=unclassified Pseudonocardia TaxID=2619320 RepID=UPI00094B618C|nr:MULTISPECIES: Gfo/Idh/MocA family oxidoreductase [unclassified Pseudonocardia]OLL71695.1 Myo-inositol 2-dehydrogenase [Pseudonocardia sp. Ae150A_Ps1]OLL77670.1 Myo-inositol 2-dehydrogenase [Pseudonocardia sp. Ae168_Ps1]OLL88207.1 Myo-inositol 2-dehydrogenase [Pseudonocardia sp. Ae263_Ps1]OLL91763.1 Myo-inositol 2-dehydrogenase [Pseudonocardia sp. Ae356_Ps1]
MGDEIGIGVVGAGWMGHLHARAYARVPHHVPDLARRPRPVAVADPVAAAVADHRARYGFARGHARWEDLVADPEVEAVSCAAPNSRHREIGVAVAEAGKHLWIEKPVGLSTADTAAVADAVHRAGVCATVGFNYRMVPAVARAKRVIDEGTLGTLTHARFRLLTDFAVHGVDLVRFLVGDLTTVVADGERFVPRRPLAGAGASQYVRGDADSPTGEVENLDFVSVLGRTGAGSIVTLEASRVAAGDQNDYGFEIHGTRGLLSFDFRRPGELVVAAGDRYVDQPATTWAAAPGDGDFGLFQPGAGNPTGFDDLKVSECTAFLAGIAEGRSGGATIDDALAAARVLDAVARSVDERAWIDVEH